MTRTKGADVCGAAIDKSVTPNRVYVADCAHSRVLGWRSLGTCGDGSPCTWPGDCPPTDACVVNPMKPADIQIPSPGDVKDGACNHDDNIGIHGPASSNSLCLMDLPDNSNMAESFYSLPLEVDAQGNLYLFDRHNGRALRFDRPFETDGVADFVWGQDDFSANLQNKGLPRNSASSSSLWPVQQPDRGYKGAPGVGTDGSGGVWLPDPGNSRVVYAASGQKTWNVCLGQPTCDSGVLPSVCFGNMGASGPLPLNVICNAQVARIRPDTGQLYVLDSGRDGSGPNGSKNHFGRILVFDPPFITGKSATRQFAPNLTQVQRLSNGQWIPYDFRGYDFRFDLGGQGVLWVSDDGAGWSTSNRALLLDDQGNVVSVIGARSKDEVNDSWPGACGDGMREFYWWGGFGFDVVGNGLIASASIPNLATRYILPAYNWTASNGTVCQPHSAGGLLDNTTWWGSHSPDTLDIINRAIAVGGQLIVGDQGGNRTKVWNDYTSKPFGPAADFELSTMGAMDSFQHMTVDDAGHLWFASSQGSTFAGNEGLHAMTLPLTPFSKAIAQDAHLYWADDGTQIDIGTSVPTHHLAFAYGHVFMTVTSLGAIVGISNYRDIDTPGAKLLVDWVQGAPDKAHLNSCNQGGLPTDKTLCSGGQITFSPSGDLWINDMAGSGWDTNCGNNRVLGILASDLAPTFPIPVGTVRFANLSAKRIIRPGGPSYTSPGLCGVFQASTITFDSKGRLWMSGHGGLPYSPTPVGYWQITEYDAPLVKQTPDHYVRIPQGYTPDLESDLDNGNLIITGQSFAEVYAINPGEWLTPLP